MKMTGKKKEWVKKAFGGEHKGALHKALKVPEDETLPTTFLKKIIKTPLEHWCKNPPKTGVTKIRVTKHLKFMCLPVVNVQVAKGQIAPMRR